MYCLLKFISYGLSIYLCLQLYRLLVQLAVELVDLLLGLQLYNRHPAGLSGTEQDWNPNWDQSGL